LQPDGGDGEADNFRFHFAGDVRETLRVAESAVKPQADGNKVIHEENMRV
jgi:hypothetical protein